MRRPALMFWIFAVVSLGLSGVGATALAQEGTPSPAGFEIAPGVTAEALAFEPGQEAPALYRLTFTPGVVYRVEPAPEISLVYQEAGELTAALDAPVTITRSGATDAPGEAVTAETEFTLAAGDYAVFPPLVGGEVRNDGQEAASVVVASIIPSSTASPPASPVP